MVVQGLCKAEVIGSNPISGTNYYEASSNVEAAGSILRS